MFLGARYKRDLNRMPFIFCHSIILYIIAINLMKKITFFYLNKLFDMMIRA